MQPTPRHRQAEAAFRRMIASNDLPEPDEVDYTRGSVYFLWHEPKLAVAVELDGPAPAPDCAAA